MSWLEKYRTPIIGLLIAVILVGGAVFLYRQISKPHAEEIVISPPSPEISVYVEGEVVNPGIYTLENGDHVADAIEAAGGFTADADQSSVNLSATLKDGDADTCLQTGDSSTEGQHQHRRGLAAGIPARHRGNPGSKDC